MTTAVTGTFDYVVVAALNCPKGRGELRLRSANPGGKPVIDHQLLAHPDDVSRRLAACKRVREFFAQPALARDRQAAAQAFLQLAVQRFAVSTSAAAPVRLAISGEESMASRLAAVVPVALRSASIRSPAPATV